MLNYTLRRLGIAIPTLFVIVTAAFFLMRAAPGGPFDAEADLEPEVLENIRAAYDLDKPLVTQYWLLRATSDPPSSTRTSPSPS